MRTLFLLVGRRGSKGVPGKNLRIVGGRSLVAYKAIGAARTTSCTTLFASSDCPDIRAEAGKHGASVLLERPPELATDTSPIEDTILHAMDWVDSNTQERFDALMLLEPSTPFTRPADYDGAVRMMEATGADAVIGMKPVEVASAFIGPLGPHGEAAPIIEKMAGLRGRRRQDVDQEYTMNGALYLLRWTAFRETRSVYGRPAATYGYVMEADYSVEIDSFHDLAFAEFLVERGLVDVGHWQ